MDTEKELAELIGSYPGIEEIDGAWLVPAEHLFAFCEKLRYEPHRYDYLSNLTACDYLVGARKDLKESYIEVVYHLFSMADRKGPLALRVRLPRDDARVASVTLIWRSAEYQEREVFDLFGVTFEGHPDLRRILMWEGYKDHPMRRDYVPEDEDVPEDPGAREGDLFTDVVQEPRP